MFKRLKKNGKRGMSIVEYGILIAVIATVASRAYPYMVSHLLGNTQKQVEKFPAYATWQMNETNTATRAQEIRAEVPYWETIYDGAGEPIFWWQEEALKSAALIERNDNSAGFARGPGRGAKFFEGTALKEVDTGVGLDEEAEAPGGAR